MEGFLGFIGLIIAYVGINIVWNLIVNSVRGTGGSGGVPAENFKIRITNDKLKGDEFNWDVFKVEMRGSVSGPYDNINIKTIVQIFDVTDGSEETVLSTYEDFQRNDSEMFWYESNNWLLPYKDTVFNDWSQVIQVPKMFLVAPRKGLRQFKFKIFLVNASTDNILATSETKISYNNPDDGYVDAVDNRKYFEEMVVKSAMLVSASDGSMDASEARIVNGWIQKRISRYTESFQLEHKNRLNSYIKEVYDEIKSESIDIYDVLDGIENISSEGDRFELFQICLDVAQADGEADKKELEMVQAIAKYINLDEKQFRAMIDKTLPINIHTDPQTPEQILGISSEMTKSEIKKLLMKEYKKWNAVVAHTDEDKRKQAEGMIHIIASLRKKYA